jgi:hypothetical protein
LSAAVPVAVAVYVPGATVDATSTVTVAFVVLPDSCAGATVVVTPAGRPVTATATALEKPPVRASVSATVPLVPCCNV